MNEPLLPTLPDAVVYSETMRTALAKGALPWSHKLVADAGAGDVFIFCLAIGLAGGMSLIGYTRAPTLPVTHRVILIAAAVALVCAGFAPQFVFAPLTTILIAVCGGLALTLEAIHQQRTIAAYSQIRTGEGAR